ncbi:alcohol dehydrogenase catalytic domain-containing protein [Streptomyces sp. NBRC 109706]|uniref:alcohol dehydrogenase catalytic domain-containing protein n=1 Tax=Streptomyces sp. NBRC 109706 TaxID=1550035 RepID=UPI000785D3AF|nr:alcohol dehydrogenase catalytic domain-containing protein [Streptomyces sp. NBRC 109706]
MKAAVWHGKRDIRVDNVPDPIIQQSTDAVIRITSTGLCGSDLHLYEVLAPFLTPGDILGHEPMGIVEEVGAAVTDLAPGDRVVVPFQIACGDCFMCRQGLQTQCETTQIREQDSGAAIFGYTRLYGSVPGAQAEYLRVPQAQYGPIRVPDDGLPDDRYLYLSDVLPTAWQAVEYAGIPPGGSVAVLGLGPIGDMACRIAKHRGAGQVIGIDLVPDRLKRAAARGIQTLDIGEHQDIVTAVWDATAGRGPDAVIDAVGMEAHGGSVGSLMQRLANLLPDPLAGRAASTAGVDRLAALYLAIDMVRRGGTISLSGVYGGMADPMPMLKLFDRQIQLRMGQANVRRWVPEILPLLTGDDPLGVDDFATDHVRLDQAATAYQRFQHKETGKTVLTP